MSKESRRILSEAYGDSSGGKSSFLGRLENDLQRRDSSLKELKSKYYSTEALYQDPNRASRISKQDLDFVTNFVETNGLLSEVGNDWEPKLDGIYCHVIVYITLILKSGLHPRSLLCYSAAI